ncbi:hypothetical protein Cgig2_019883 [Carnegiea gigantea]|uniref:Uncharacterized protein n=1 Tax=Carnegiea gigantea TaxID=171969 RepID=A0A9Q1KJY0_9CARY|nr:hypothetical protein Cgig2_019883 [Carnegiea gigantea]
MGNDRVQQFGLHSLVREPISSDYYSEHRQLHLAGQLGKDVEESASELSNINFKDLLSSFGEALDAYNSNKFGRKRKITTSRGKGKYFFSKEDHLKAHSQSLKNVHNPDVASLHKQALWGCPIGKEFEARKVANVAMEKDVREALSNNSKIIT